MKLFTILILQFLTIFLVFQFNVEASENKRKWLEIDNELYRVEPEAKYTWEQAAAECKKEHSNLISPRGGDYDYVKLKEAIKKNFKHYAPFWTNTKQKWTNVLHQIGLGKYNGQRCNKFDNSTNFKYLPDNCDQQHGFICEKSLLKGNSSFNSNNIVYFVQPEEKFTCEKAYDECDKRQMSLVVITDYAKNRVLKDYLFINYGSAPSYWFGFNNETHYSCATPRKNNPIKYDSELGFICQRSYVKAQNDSNFYLIILLSAAAIVAIIIYAFTRCLCYRKVQKFFVPEVYYPEEIYIK
ncbi:uncharacterized protein LOC119609578 [Lucilia sericata]|uniref:uncharacterized protein LOC119609578 n=1 Tax=Lucilia sericata TaxID=13632 RepID=UPI0018A8683F|nr:uncharacterized protein LOC119609578 [Lucilia sericata]